MRTVVLASVRTHARRYVAAAVAIIAGVAFVVVTATLSSATKSGLLEQLASSYRGADVVVTDATPTTADQTLKAVGDLGPTAVNASTRQPLADDGLQVTDDAQIGTVATTDRLRWQHVTSGRAPRGPGQALVAAGDAKDAKISVGDRLTLGSGRTSHQVTVVGLASDSSGPLSAPVYVPWTDLRTFGDEVLVDDVVVGGAGRSLDSGDVRDAGLPPHVRAQDVEDYLQEQAAATTRGVDAVSVMLLVFAAVALFVSVMVIANTFTVLLAQRRRDFALLRCVGASRRQVLRSVRLEALAIGTAAATLGLLVGAVLGRLLLLVARQAFPALPSGEAHVGPGWWVGAWLVGVLVTLVASVVPARGATRIAPLAALRPEDGVDARTTSGRLRLASGAAALVGGAALLVAAVAGQSLLTMIAGGFVSFAGMLLFGPVLVPAAIRVVGSVAGRLLGTTGRLASANAVRNPRRTAATAASLLVGTTLITAIVTGMATVRGTVDSLMDGDYPVDASVLAGHDLDPGTLARMGAVDGIDAVVGLDGTTARVSQGDRSGRESVLGLGRDRSVLRGDPDFAHVRPGTAYVAADVAADLGLRGDRPVTLTAGGRQVHVRVVVDGGHDGTLVVAPATLRRLAPDAGLRAVWGRAHDGADADEVTAAVSSLARSTGSQPAGGLQNRAYVDLQLDVMVYAAVALLAVALLIALIGIGNTLGLSVLERRREHALLRAVGLSRRQLRGTLAVEAVLLAAVTSVIGVALGVVYAFVGARTVLDQAAGTTGVTLHVPVGQLLLVVLVAVLAGLAACVLPARQAARIPPAAGLALE